MSSGSIAIRRTGEIATTRDGKVATSSGCCKCGADVDCPGCLISPDTIRVTIDGWSPCPCCAIFSIGAGTKGLKITGSLNGTYDLERQDVIGENGCIWQASFYVMTGEVYANPSCEQEYAYNPETDEDEPVGDPTCNWGSTLLDTYTRIDIVANRQNVQARFYVPGFPNGGLLLLTSSLTVRVDDLGSIIYRNWCLYPKDEFPKEFLTLGPGLCNTDNPTVGPGTDTTVTLEIPS